MKMDHLSWLFALLLLLALPAAAQSSWVGPLTPAEPTTSDRVTLDFMVGTSPHNLCDLMHPGELDVSREGGAIHIHYTLRQRGADDPPYAGAGCVSTYVPVKVSADLGVLPAGDYLASISTTVAGDTTTYPPEYSMAFKVRADVAGHALASVPEISPPNPTTADRVQLLVTDGAPTNGCNLDMPEPVSVVREGRSILVDYAYVSVDEADLPEGTLCLSAHFPAYFWAQLGVLPAGEYEVTINGSLDGTARPQQQVVFAVTGTANATFIPVNRPLALGLMLVVLGGVAAWRLRAH